ncbi:tRNA (adenosine(37)-N6)-threonylcarbamoyltransferase complex ATPase subunit type 1 TsaE [Halomonas sp. BL6]|uniref:tRNA (adenosine(37)-N6)-threonylcarbamoyltransferase complex ATPase subunit type 1 TsaE n=1 Tax=Halomonas sp. BL6 TaxID=2585770 RepID=UPI00111827D1|nr:tRNA (adenosine(37)-N6)-threonylcarbamoyltransferase complex ATPase subunit type 1 TsaE [Halomonas sp. BL6]TNH16720.1 tRNA (adenosine(37)-N6)-threonylcarbamoyltransferase complex ATPase subunit type 1 TsaE [Halomonas sp. BL6]
MQVQLNDEVAHVAFGEALGRALSGRGRVYLEGDLGAGKTTLTRGILRAYGYHGAVKSPTYTLVEPYELCDQRIYHLDLYRLADPEELEFMGGRDVLADDALCLIEWPSRGEGWLPAPDVRIQLCVAAQGRTARLTAETAFGQRVLAPLEARIIDNSRESGGIQWI